MFSCRVEVGLVSCWIVEDEQLELEDLRPGAEVGCVGLAVVAVLGGLNFGISCEIVAFTCVTNTRHLMAHLSSLWFGRNWVGCKKNG